MEFAEKCDNNNERVMGSGRWDDKPSVLCCEKCGILSYHIYFHFLVLCIFSPASVSIFCSRV